MTSRNVVLNGEPGQQSSCVVYVMSRDQRVSDNHALLLAQQEATEHKLPLVVLFNLLPKSGHRSREHFQFMVEGLRQVETELLSKGIHFSITIGAARRNIVAEVKKLQPRTIYFDFSPLRGPRALQKAVASEVSCRTIVVDTHNVVPVWVLSDKEEYAAHTIRRKLHRSIEEWCKEPNSLQKHPFILESKDLAVDWKKVNAAVHTIPACGIKVEFESGEKAAAKALQTFIETGVTVYADGRNDASKDLQSNLSPYLHYGQLSSLRIVLEIIKHSNALPHLFESLKMPSPEGNATTKDGIDSFVEELVVRKELSDNFCFYNERYDSLKGAKDWAQKTLAEHADDPREFVYTPAQFEQAETHDELWNAAQSQLLQTGKIHGYMRMYWAKKILEWSKTPDEAVETAIMLNDRYHIDGGDPNGYVGILWSIAGLHDRPWFQRSIYGTIRYMTATGISKKFDTKKYISQWL